MNKLPLIKIPHSAFVSPLPDPMNDSSFAKFRESGKFRNAVDEMKKSRSE